LTPTQFNHPEDTLLSIAESAKKTDLPVWNDELYLETHRGTYTSKGQLKKNNRQSEILLQQVEMLASFAWLKTGRYPQEQLDSAWKILLNTQFHDALPGTHVAKVYQYLLDEYRTLYDSTSDIRETASTDLFAENTGDNLLIFNPTLKERCGIIELPAFMLDSRGIADETGAPLFQQIIKTLDGQDKVLVQLTGSIPAAGYRIFQLTQPLENLTFDAVLVEANVLENQYLRAEFNDKGELTSLYDKEIGRQVLVEGEVGNRFQLYQDQPGNYDAWDIVASYIEYELPITGDCALTIDDEGALCASLKLVRECYDSTIRQRISLQAESRQLIFETEIDWHERQRLLKVGFPVAVNTRYATYDIAYGNMERATHRNTSYDAAKFEVPAHQWMDMSETGYGVALLNDSKYGHEAHYHWM
ncbi:MAG: glycoside hydrolase family 38 C-terminal domain-containing protein, partial [Aggregatilineales bacterium]